eukprot:768560-Hanusia_phi.AAC.7
MQVTSCAGSERWGREGQRAGREGERKEGGRGKRGEGAVDRLPVCPSRRCPVCPLSGARARSLIQDLRRGPRPSTGGGRA